MIINFCCHIQLFSVLHTAIDLFLDTVLHTAIDLFFGYLPKVWIQTSLHCFVGCWFNLNLQFKSQKSLAIVVIQVAFNYTVTSVAVVRKADKGGNILFPTTLKKIHSWNCNQTNNIVQLKLEQLELHVVRNRSM